MEQRSPSQLALSDVLDKDGAQEGGEEGEEEEQVDGAIADGTSDSREPQERGKFLHEERVARLKAEAEAQDRAARLKVAQEQLAEYATQKEGDAKAALNQAESLQSELDEMLMALDPSARTHPVASTLQKLRESLSDAALEARAFAEQQRADVERMKRSFGQAQLNGGLDADAKRQRENGDHDNHGSPDADTDCNGSVDAHDASSVGGLRDGGYMSVTERARYIPLRLTLEERRLLRLLEAALNVSEYTDKVDIITWRSKNSRVHAQIKGICAILCGLVVAQDYKKGQALVQDRSFADNAQFFQQVFEVGRRYKIMNPDKMRAEYGKLMYLLMDSSDPSIQELLEFKCVKPLSTIYSLLEQRGGLDMLTDPLMVTATSEVVAGDRPRYEIQRDIKAKERAREALAKKYRSGLLSEDTILWCLYSFSDNNSFLLFNRDPIDRMIDYFTSSFTATAFEPGFSLAITGGRGGARLTHSHERQYHYVLQSLTLWREISTEMFKLWCLAESDMLREGNSYRLCDTGQGLNRVQSAPQVLRAMHHILRRCQERIGGWVGSAVVHLGDHNVPNALMFIDKYTQVPRILNPVVLVLDALPKLYQEPSLQRYMDNTFGSLDACRKRLLVDFCRHAFDGSGADNFFDAGSCIDGRLTSAWNWCSKVERKSYYHIMKIAGFHGFDGDFQK